MLTISPLEIYTRLTNPSVHECNVKMDGGLSLSWFLGCYKDT